MSDQQTLEYGPVLVIKGRHKGKIGYYDDDDDDGAIVYFGIPFMSPYVLINPDWLVQSDKKHAPTEALKKASPKSAKLIGIP